MSDPMNHPERPDETRTPPPAEALPRKSASPLLWILLLLAILAIGWYLLSQRDASVPPPAPAIPIGDSAAVPSESPVSAAPPRPEAAPPRRTQPAAVAPADRDARPLDQRTPDYPVAALRAGEQGTVLVRVDVDVDGKVGNVAVARRSGSRDLDRAALATVRTWTFEPAISGGQPVASTVQVPVEFRLDRQ